MIQIIACHPVRASSKERDHPQTSAFTSEPGNILSSVSKQSDHKEWIPASSAIGSDDTLTQGRSHRRLVGSILEKSFRNRIGDPDGYWDALADSRLFFSSVSRGKDEK